MHGNREREGILPDLISFIPGFKILPWHQKLQPLLNIPGHMPFLLQGLLPGPSPHPGLCLH